MKVLFIADSHVSQDQDLTRFAKVGELIVEQQPDYLILGGDFMAMKSISHWDSKKKLTMEGRRYNEEMETGRTALNLMLEPLNQLQARQKVAKTKQYRPKKVFLEGNHEAWIDKYLEQNPSMQGHIDLRKDLGILDWIFTPYKEFYEVSGILFTHVPIDGANQPVSGVNVCRSAASRVAKSCVFGHTHRFEAATCSRVGADDIQILTAGCFFDAEPDEFGSNIWRGVTMLDVWKPGRFDITQISLERLYET